ncbi:MAG TPA: HAMP domain-containing sensor histidine kinase [Thermoanaerobaculia bacterium]|nr:HAMP domain-containing sensor histidine kinase [Thermoanaerobaculia bacterium]
MRSSSRQPDTSTFRLRLSPSGAAVLVIALVVAIDAVALASIVTGRREAQAAAVEELSRQTGSQARAIEALLATLRADLAFLASSPRLAVDPQRVAAEDPLSRRWARLEAEGTLLLFAGGHPRLVSLELRGAGGERLVTVARPLAPGEDVSDPALVADRPAPPPNALTLEVPVEGGGRLRAVVDPALLLATVLPDRASVLAPPVGLSIGPPSLTEEDAVLVRERIDTRGWQPDAPLVLERRRQDGPLLDAVERLAFRWRLTVLLNILVISLGLPLAFVAVRTARRAAQLAAEREHAEERRNLERSLWRQERLATVGRMASGIAHEINNPLAGMANHLTLLEEELAADDLAAARRRAPRVGQGVERIRHIVQRVLGLANPGSGTREPIDLAALAEETIALVAGEGNGVRLIVVGGSAREGAAPADHVVDGERAMLGQLLTNLILNAVELSGGQPVEVLLGSEGEEVVVAVEDRGPGIDPEIADRLFEPFVSGRGSTGLGLAVSLGIAREHGGTIVGENRPSGGARFEVRLPASTASGWRAAVNES